MDLSTISEELLEIDGQIGDIFRALSNGFQKLDKIKDANRQSRQLEELTEKMRECKRLIKEFDREVKDHESRNDPSTNRMLHDKKQSMIKELNTYVALKKQYTTNPKNKRVDLFDERQEGFGDDNNGLLASAMSNEQLIDQGHQMMDETDEAIENLKGPKRMTRYRLPFLNLFQMQMGIHSLPSSIFPTIQETINVGTDTAAALKAQTEQMSRIVNDLDSIQFSLKRASKLIKEIGRQLATDKCIMTLLVLIVIGVVAIVIVKFVHPENKDIRDIPGLAPPVPTAPVVPARRLLWKTC